jgi:hypothetical protein
MSMLQNDYLRKKEHVELVISMLPCCNATPQISSLNEGETAAMRMESPDDYTRWIERAARRLEEAVRNDDVLRAEEEMQLIERTLKALRKKFSGHTALVK